MKFNDWLRRARLTANLSQGDVGKIFKYDAQFISNWERGVSFPPIQCFEKLAKIYKVSEKELQDKFSEAYLGKKQEGLSGKFKG